MKVVLIDDQESIFTVLHALLIEPPPTGVELLYASNMNDGLQMIMLEQPHVVILDLSLSPAPNDVENNIAMIPRIAELASVVILTGRGTQDLWATCVQAGAVDFMAKNIYLAPQNRPFLLHCLTTAAFIQEKRIRELSPRP